MKARWQYENPQFTVRDLTGGVTLSGEESAVKRAADCIDGCVGLRDPSRVQAMVAMLQILVGNMSAERHRENGNHDRAAIAEALAQVL